MKNNQGYTPVRFSHLTSYAGVGAIIRDNDDMLMTLVDTRYWTDRNGRCTTKDIDRISKKIKFCCAAGKTLKMPPQGEIKEKDGQKTLEGFALPTVLFPKFAVCKTCGLLHNNPWSKLGGEFEIRPACTKCKDGKLEQVTWCVASKQGYLDDVPWHYICHLKSNKNCKVDYDKSYLELTTDRNGKQIVRCTRCSSYNLIKGVRLGDINKIQPWLFLSKEDKEKFPPVKEQDVEVLEVNAAGIYFPESNRALVIPPESRRIRKSVYDILYSNSQMVKDIENIRAPLRKKGKINQLATELKCSVKEIQDAIKKMGEAPEEEQPGYIEIDCADQSVLKDEYREFLTPIEDLLEEEDFVTEHLTQQWQEYAEKFPLTKLVDRLVIAKRLREIRIFKGFRRINPDPNESDLIHPGVVDGQDWLPAIELFGEGVFFTLNEDIIGKWEKNEHVRKRAYQLEKQYKASGLTIRNLPLIEPRYLLLHTLSHLLIRELEITSGYPAASLTERIYSSSKSNQKMAGILIYTAVPDIAGSLGGIVASAEPNNFLSLLYNTFKHADWCSLDPVCSEHEGQGPGMLNRAACHACTLIPEPACSFNNVFLDRNFIKGNSELKIPRLLDFIDGEKTYG